MNNRKPNAFVLGVILALTLGLNAQSRNQLNSAQEDKDFQKVFGAWSVQPGGAKVEFSQMEVAKPVLLGGTDGYRWYILRSLSRAEIKPGDDGSGMTQLYTLMKKPGSDELFLVFYRNGSMGAADPMKLVFRDGGRTMQIVIQNLDGQEVVQTTYTR